MGEYLSRSGYIGKGVGEVIAQHQNFSQATWYCRRLEEAISCLKPAPKLTANESCPTIYEFGHCWKETPHGQTLTTTCPVLVPLPTGGEADPANITHRHCFKEEIQSSGRVLEAEWMPMGQVQTEYLMLECQNNQTSMFSSGSDYNYDDSYGNFEDGSSSSSPNYMDYYPNGSQGQGQVPSENLGQNQDSSLSYNLHEHIILSILSFITTLTSLLLMIFFLRKCTRIYIHMNLLCAFMLRSLIFLWGQVILGIWQPRNTEYLNKLTMDLVQYMNSLFQAENMTLMEGHYEEHCVQHMANEHRFIFLCRLYPSLQHYIVLVCFSWLACEGLYLILLQQRPTVLFERINPLRWFVGVSWILPSVIVSIWAIVMLNRADGQFNCFDTDSTIIWIVEAPIQLFILICFVIFVILLRDIIRKLRAPDYISGSGNFSWRASKATLSLIPLLGIQYVLVPYLTEEYGVPEAVVKVITPITITITASHGIIVSFLYCFTSSEMKEALVRRWRLHRDLERVYNEISSRRQSRDSNSYPFQHLFNRIAGRRGSVLSRRNDSNSMQNQSCDSRNDQLYIEPIDQVQVQIQAKAKRHSAFSKHSDDSLDSNGYYSSQSAHHDTHHFLEEKDEVATIPILHHQSYDDNETDI